MPLLFCNGPGSVVLFRGARPAGSAGWAGILAIARTSALAIALAITLTITLAITLAITLTINLAIALWHSPLDTANKPS